MQQENQLLSAGKPAVEEKSIEFLSFS